MRVVLSLLLLLFSLSTSSHYNSVSTFLLNFLNCYSDPPTLRTDWLCPPVLKFTAKWQYGSCADESTLSEVKPPVVAALTKNLQHMTTAAIWQWSYVVNFSFLLQNTVAR